MIRLISLYQTSSFYPMPTTLISTVSENGQTNLGAYSLCFPYYVAGKDYYAMVLECRNSSNTAQNILRTKRATINFVTDERKYFKEAVRLGFPGETTAEKMKNCILPLPKATWTTTVPNILKKATKCSSAVGRTSWKMPLTTKRDAWKGMNRHTAILTV